VRIGTRGSALALAQAGQVATALGGAELVPITTTGDRAPGGTAVGLDKERWVREIDAALLAGEIDLAVHSAKDVPARLTEDLAIVATPPRADPRDVLCGAASIASLGTGARIGTSSLRREAQLRARREDLEIVALRGNVDTRLRRLAEGAFDAIVLARAGLQRLALDDRASAVLDPDEMLPAAGQGTLVLLARAGDERARDGAAALADPGTLRALTAERAVVRELEADCHTPVGAHASPAGGGTLRLRAFVGRRDGSAWVRDELCGDEPDALGAEVARRLRVVGADEILARSSAA
jgi:hydroxymethylbilane synthase